MHENFLTLKNQRYLPDNFIAPSTNQLTLYTAAEARKVFQISKDEMTALKVNYGLLNIMTEEQMTFLLEDFAKNKSAQMAADKSTDEEIFLIKC